MSGGHTSGKVLPLRRSEPGPEPADDVLVARCARGDAAASGALFDRHHATVLRFLARLCGTAGSDLDDLAQATFVEAFRSAGRFRGGAQVRTWLLGIAANVARHHGRGEARARARVVELARRPHGTPERPDETAERRELLRRLELAVAELPEELRVVFALCDLEEVRGVDAARTLGIPEGTLWRRLHEARRALRCALEGRPS